jgi:hypothetical protein
MLSVAGRSVNHPERVFLRQARPERNLYAA